MEPLPERGNDTMSLEERRLFHSIRTSRDAPLSVALHEWVAQSLPIKDVVGGVPEEGARGARLSMNCYVEHAVPAALYFAYNAFRTHSTGGEAFGAALLDNANCGGDCTIRGALLGCLCGAAVGYEAIPAELISGLMRGWREGLQAEIEGFVSLCFS